MKKMVFAGSITLFVMIMLGLIIGLYLFGYQSPAGSFFSSTIGGQNINSTEFDISSFMGSVQDSILSPMGLALVGFSIVGIVLSAIGGGMGSTASSFLAYLIPLTILFFVANLFFFPVMSSVSDVPGLDPISLLLSTILNVLMILAVIEFVTGRN